MKFIESEQETASLPDADIIRAFLRSRYTPGVGSPFCDDFHASPNVRCTINRELYDLLVKRYFDDKT